MHPAHVAVEANNRVKTDKRDSLTLAQQLEAGRLRGICISEPEREQRRLLTRTREQLVQARRRVQAQIRMRLHQGHEDSLDVMYRSVPGIGPLTARMLSNELAAPGEGSILRQRFIKNPYALGYLVLPEGPGQGYFYRGECGKCHEV